MADAAYLTLWLRPPELDAHTGHTVPAAVFGHDLTHRATLWNPRPGYSEAEVDAALAALEDLRREFQERVRQDPVVSDNPDAPLSVDWMNSVMPQSRGELEDRLLEVAQPGGEILRLWMVNGTPAYKGEVREASAFFRHVAEAATPKAWTDLNSLLWECLAGELTDEIVASWRTLGRDPRGEKWNWFHGERPEGIVDLANALRAGIWSPEHTRQLLDLQNQYVWQRQIERYHLVQRHLATSLTIAEGRGGRHRSFDPWAGRELESAWQPGQAPLYRPVLVSVASIVGPWGLCAYQIARAVTAEDLGSAPTSFPGLCDEQADGSMTGRAQATPRVPTRPKDLTRWRATWRAVREQYRQGKGYGAISGWLTRAHPELQCSADVVADVIRAGQAGLLDE